VRLKVPTAANYAVSWSWVCTKWNDRKYTELFYTTSTSNRHLNFLSFLSVGDCWTYPP